VKLNPLFLHKEFPGMVASIAQKCCTDLVLALRTEENFMVYVEVVNSCGLSFLALIL